VELHQWRNTQRKTVLLVCARFPCFTWRCLH